MCRRCVRAHPRSRGENSGGGRWPGISSGSSPLTRGKRSCLASFTLSEGLIPAHAGKTYRDPMGRRVYWAHPRSRGENQFGGLDLGLLCGSSPLTRGKRTRALFAVFAARLIPAHAGKTDASAFRRFRREAHPRSRGENSGKLRYSKVVEGSSPLTRGKRHPLRPRIRHGGLIPAHAGKTISTVTGGIQSAAHPRSREENNRRACTWCSW